MPFAELRLPSFLMMRSWTKRHSKQPRSPRLPVVSITYPSSMGLSLLRAATGLLMLAALAALSFWAGMNYQPAGITRTVPQPLSHAAPTPPARAASHPEAWKDSSVEGLSIESLTVSKLPDGRYAYDYSIANNGRRFIGDLEISVFGDFPHRTDTVRVPSRASGAPGPQFSVDSFLKSDGQIVLPATFMPRVIFFDFHEQTQTRASKVFHLSPDTRE